MVGVGGSSPLAPTKVTREHPDGSLGAFLLSACMFPCHAFYFPSVAKEG